MFAFLTPTSESYIDELLSNFRSAKNIKQLNNRAPKHPEIFDVCLAKKDISFLNEFYSFTKSNFVGLAELARTQIAKQKSKIEVKKTIPILDPYKDKIAALENQNKDLQSAIILNEFMASSIFTGPEEHLFILMVASEILYEGLVLESTSKNLIYSVLSMNLKASSLIDQLLEKNVFKHEYIGSIGSALHNIIIEKMEITSLDEETKIKVTELLKLSHYELLQLLVS